MAKVRKRSRKVFVGLDVGSRTCHVAAVDRMQGVGAQGRLFVEGLVFAS